MDFADTGDPVCLPEPSPNCVFPLAVPPPQCAASVPQASGGWTLCFWKSDSPEVTPSHGGEMGTSFFLCSPNTLPLSLPRKTGVMCSLLNHNFCYIYTQHLNSL